MTEAGRFRVDLHPRVEQDLDGILDYLLAEGATGAAQALVELFEQKVEALKQFPRRGNKPKELEGSSAPEIRQLVMPPCRLVYEIAGDRVLVRLLADGRRDMTALLAQRMLEPKGRQ